MTHRNLPSRTALAVIAGLFGVSVLAAPTLAADVQSLNKVQNQIENINQDVAKKKASLEELNQKIQQYRDLVMTKKAEGAEIEDQIALMDNTIAKTQLDIDVAKGEVQSLELEIRSIDERMAVEMRHADRERVLIAALMRKLYLAGYRRSALEILLSYESFSDFFNGLQNITELQGGVVKALTRLKESSAALAAEKDSRGQAQQEIAQRKRDLEVARGELEDQRTMKQSILVETKSSELEYRYLLADLKTEQAAADRDINYLEKSLREKMDIADRLSKQETVLSWPVDPSRGISTFFHDPDYPFRYIFEHPAIDIRCGQGTPVRSAAAGIIGRAKDAGYGYSYVMILHNGDVSTVYGHLSRITAKEDSFVERGEVIGYSGGMPGTPGAGRLTTGPHLHFETRIKGFPVNPMQYLTKF